MKKSLFISIIFIISILLLEMLLCAFYFYRSDSPYNFAIEHYSYSVKRRLNQESKANIWQTDEKYGFSHKANSSGIHHKYDNFNVTYTIDNKQCRSIPKPKENKGKVLMLGGSYTFGLGVEDNENYPYLLATKYWQDYEIENAAVTAWGTAQSYLKLLEKLEEKEKPSVVIYGMISHHIPRNYVGKYWLSFLDTTGRTKLPHFEIENGQLSFLGTVGLSQANKNEKETKEKEILLTNVFINDMNNKCSQYGIPFVVVLLPSAIEYSWKPSIILNFYDNNIQVLDISEITIATFPNDIHPNKEDHLIIAEKIANSFIHNIVKNPKNN